MHLASLHVPCRKHVIAVARCDGEELPDGWELSMTNLARKSEKMHRIL